MGHTRSNKAAIMQAALKVFLEKGYCQAGIRDICAEADVSLGLVNHYFGSKKKLAAHLITFFWREVRDWGVQYASPTEPVLLDAVVTRGVNRLMLSERLRHFYIDSLQENVFFDSLSEQTGGLVEQLYVNGMPELQDRDLIFLYAKILPYETEKALILKKEKEGMFQNIPYEDIPYYICVEALKRVAEPETLREADRRGREIVGAHFHELLELCWDERLDRYAEQVL